MARIHFTQHLAKHVDCPSCEASGRTVREVLDEALLGNDRLRGYVLDDQRSLRKHVTIYVDNQMICDRQGLTDPVGETSEVFVLQALSGG